MFLGIIKVIGVVAFLYLTWRNLYEDYRDDKLISYSWLALFCMLAAGRLTYGIVNWGEWNDSLLSWVRVWNNPGFNYAGAIVGLWIFSGWYAVINNWKIWSFFDDINPSVYLLLAFWAGEEYVISGYSVRKLILMLIALTGYLMSNFIARRYRSFVWYKSGRKGFVFFFIAMVSMLALAAISIIFKDKLYISVIYMVFSLISAGGLFILGEVFNNLSFRRRRNHG